MRDAFTGEVAVEAGRECIETEHFCDVCNDISVCPAPLAPLYQPGARRVSGSAARQVCPHCFIGNKEFPAVRRDFHFD